MCWTNYFFALVDSQGGYAIAVYDPDDDRARKTVSRLIDERRVSFVCPADYSEGSRMYHLARTILDKIATDHELRVLSGRHG